MKRRPPIGTRLMRPYGRKEFAEYGEVGTVTAHNANGTIQMTLDAEQPFARAMWGAKAKRTTNGGLVHESLTPSEVEPLAAVYRANARRLREVAKSWSDAAARESAASKPRPEWMDRPHEFREDTDDGSMCLCGVPALAHQTVEAKGTR